MLPNALWPSLPPPLLGRGSDSPWWPSAWFRSRLPAVSPCWWASSSFLPRRVPFLFPWGQGVQGVASSFPSPLLLAALTSPTPLPPLGPLHTPLPHQQLPTHISLYLALLQISQKTPRSHSPCLSPLVPQAGPAPVGPASWSLLSPPSHSLHPPASWAAARKPLRCQPVALQAHLRPRLSG